MNKKPWVTPTIRITEGTNCRFFHRPQQGRFESICLFCKEIVASAERESELKSSEQTHACRASGTLTG